MRKLIKVCQSALTIPHDKALMGGVSVPEPDELLSDIMNLESWKKENEQRANETQKRRKTKN